MATMRAVQFDEFGDSSKPSIRTVTRPTPEANEVLIKLSHAGVNPVDWKIRDGSLKSLMPHEFPITLGWEGSGVVEETGSEVKQLKKGDEVYAYLRRDFVHDGAYAEYIAFPAEHVSIKPKNISFAEAAGVPLAGLTAHQSIFGFAQLKKDQVILIHAGAGGVGGWAVQLAKNAGATVISTASKGNHEYVTGLGADVVIDYRNQDFVEEVQKLYPDGVDIVYDTVGSDTQDRSWQLVKENGALVSIVSPPDAEKGKAKNIRSTFVFVAPNGEQLDELRALFESDKLKPLHTTERPLADHAAVLDENKDRHVKGKVVLKI